MRWSDAIARPTDRRLREFAMCLAVASLMLAVWHLLGFAHPVRAGVYGSTGLLAALTGAMRPHWLAPLFTAWMVLVFPLAWLVSMLVLGAIYFGLFTPLALLFRLLGRDALDRRPQRGQDSYWKAKPAAQKASDYFRQF